MAIEFVPAFKAIEGLPARTRRMICERTPNFAVKLGGRYFVHRDHVELLRRGFTPEQIGELARSGRVQATLQN